MNHVGRNNAALHEVHKHALPWSPALLTVAAVYWFPVRRWFSRWGTTAEELARVMPGGALIRNPTKTDTGAVTVHAPPRNIWPWLVQIGTRRGRLYSYDWLDRLFGFLDRPSATRILPEFQHVVVGDTIPWGRDNLTVSALDPLRTLALQLQRSRHRVGVAVRPLSTRRQHDAAGLARHGAHSS